MLSPTLLMALASEIHPASPGDEQERSLIFIIATVILGLIVVLLVILQVAAIRGRRSNHRKRVRIQATNPGTDPWAEAGRRMQPMDDEDQS